MVLSHGNFSVVTASPVSDHFLSNVASFKVENQQKMYLKIIIAENFDQESCFFFSFSLFVCLLDLLELLSKVLNFVLQP